MKSGAAEINRSYYGELSPGRDDYWRLMAAPRLRLRRILGLLRSLDARSVIDLGCGNGALLEEIRGDHPGVRLAGADLSPAQIDANARRLPDIAWRCVDLEQRDLAIDGGFDVAIASEIVEHLDDPAALLGNARSLASKLIVTTQSGPVHETERAVGHRRHFSAAELRALLEETGWRPLRVWNEGFPFHDLSKWWANRDAEGSLRRFGAGRYGLSERLVCAMLRAAFRLSSRRRGAQLFALAEARER